MQVQAAIPPGYRVQFGGPHPEDTALGPDGDAGPPRVDQNASLASADVIEYGKAMMQDLANNYPQLDGIRLDWPEYPPYSFHSLFFDFSKPALAQAATLGIDVERMRSQTKELQVLLTQGLKSAHLQGLKLLTGESLHNALTSFPGVLDLLKLRRHLSQRLITDYREALPASMALVPQAFPPPFNLLSGFDYHSASESADGIGVKLYTMHWPMIMSEWGQALSSNKLEQSELARALIEVMGTGQVSPDNLQGFRYPEPHEPHPVSNDTIRLKLAMAKQEAASGACPIYAFTHSYGPLDDVARRARASWEASQGQMWVNRYAYLSDEKIAVLKNITQ